MSRLLLIIFSILLISCGTNQSDIIVVDFSDTADTDKGFSNDSTKAIYIAIASITSPKETFKYYNDLVQYISSKIKRPILIKQKKTYVEVNSLLNNSEVDFAFICSGAYADTYDAGNVKLLVVPEIEQKSYYHAYIIAQKESDINSFEDLRNKSFGFTDPLSNTGRLFPLSRLWEIDQTEEEFFKKTLFTYGHDISIQMVNRGIIDGASVNGLIYNYLAYNSPEKVENIRIVEKSKKFGMPPVVVPASIDKKYFNEIQNIFLEIHEDSIGKSILDKLQIDRFIIPKDSMYKSVLELKEVTDNGKRQNLN